MGLNKEINDEIKAAFDTDLADAVKDFTGERITPSDDDWLLNGTSTKKQINQSIRKLVLTIYMNA